MGEVPGSIERSRLAMSESRSDVPLDRRRTGAGRARGPPDEASRFGRGLMSRHFTPPAAALRKAVHRFADTAAVPSQPRVPELVRRTTLITGPFASSPDTA